MMPHRDEAWFQRQLAHCQAALAEADRIHTEEERQAAAEALVVADRPRQAPLFSVPPNAGLITGGQPELPGWRRAADGALEMIE